MSEVDKDAQLAELSRDIERLKIRNDELQHQVEETPIAFDGSVLEEELAYDGDAHMGEKMDYVTKTFKVDEMPFTVVVRNKNNALEVSTTVESEENYRLALVAHIEPTNVNHPQIKKIASEIVYIRSGTYDLKAIRTEPLARNWTLAFKLRLKIFWSRCESAVERGLTGEDVTVIVEEKEFVVNATYLSHWSGFLRAYFASNMKESREGRYPIESCSAADFREMLTVVYPCGKSIDSRNVESLLDLADRFIMPFVTHMCEVFLIDRRTHEISTMKILQLTEQYHLVYTKSVLIESLSDADEIRKEIMRVEGYAELQLHTRRCIEAQYLKVDLRNNV